VLLAFAVVPAGLYLDAKYNRSMPPPPPLLSARSDRIGRVRNRIAAYRIRVDALYIHRIAPLAAQMERTDLFSIPPDSGSALPGLPYTGTPHMRRRGPSSECYGVTHENE